MRNTAQLLLLALLLNGCCCARDRCRPTPRQTSDRPGLGAQSVHVRCTGLAVDVPFALGENELTLPDAITILGIRGDRAHLEEGGTYCVWGTYRLRSAPTADLMVWSSGETEAGISERATTASGSGDFAFRFKIVRDGATHISFYPSGGGSSLGGVYFDNASSN